MTRVAAIDCGTNSIRLLITDVTSQGGLHEVLRTMEFVRLGQDVDRTGMIDPRALGRTLSAVRGFAATCEHHNVAARRFIATSATRDARNREEFTSGVRDILGVDVEIVTGQEEAALSFAGASSIVPKRTAMLVVDIGGGSTEIVLGEQAPIAATSMDLGSVRLTERHLHHDPPTRSEVQAATADIDAALDNVATDAPLGRATQLIGTAGSITTVAAQALGLHRYERQAIDGAELSVAATLQACQELLYATRAQRAAMGFMHPGRIDVIGAGALIWSRIITRVVEEVAATGGQLKVVRSSEHDILDGIALSLGLPWRASAVASRHG